MAAAALIISLLALGTSGWSAWFASRQWKAKQIDLGRDLNSRTAAIEAVVERIQPEAVGLENSGDAVLITNHGPATASSLRLVWWSGQANHEKTFETLAPGQTVNVGFASIAPEERAKGQVEWRDGREGLQAAPVSWKPEVPRAIGPSF